MTGALCALALWSFAGRARSQSTTVERRAEQPLPVTPPRVLADAPAIYPVQALRDRVTEPVTVVLVLEIDAAGAVQGVTVEQPMGHGFDEASAAAAQNLRFQPAQRGSKAVPSRIKFRYVFRPPPAILTTQVLDAISKAPISRAAIVVRRGDDAREGLTSESGGFKHVLEHAAGSAEVSVGHIGYEPQTVPIELEPGGQVSLVVHLVPTVAPEKPVEPAEVADAGQPIEVIVRGERLPPGAVSMTREQVRELPGAFGDPFRAVESLPGVTPMVSGLPFFYVRGAPPADVGYFLDGMRVPYLYHLLIGPSVLQPAFVDRVELYPGGYPASLGRFAGGIVAAETTAPRADLHGEGSLRLYDAGAMVETGFAGGRGTVALGGRYSYTAAVMSLVAEDLRLDYRDYQARVTYDATDRDRLTMIGFGSYDLLARDGPNGLNILFGSEFYRLEARHEHTTPEGSKLSSAVTVGYDSTHLPGTERNVSNRSIAGRVGGRTRLSPTATLRVGADVQVDDFTTDKAPYGDPEDPETKSFDETFPSRSDVTTGAWADVVFAVDRGIEVIPGIRVDRYQSGSASAFAVDPRLAARFEVSEKLKLIHALGLAHQPPAFVLPLPGLTPAELDGGLQTAIQASSGMELALPSDFALTTTLFHNIFLNMNDALGTGVDRDEGFTGVNRRSLGTAYGLEVHLRRSLTKRLGGFLSYTLSRSTRSLERENVLSAFDRTHVLNAALTGDLGRSWRAGTRLLFYTGTPVESSASDDVSRNPPYYRVDVRIEKRWALSATAWLAFVAEGLNVTFAKETIGDEEIGPITIPNLALEGGF
jgi:TonB family protein